MATTADGEYSGVDIQSPDEERHRRDIAVAVNLLMDGKQNAALTFTLDVAPATSTTVEHELIGVTSRILLDPVDDAAAADWAAGAVRVSSRTNESFVVSHTRHALTREFRCSFLS